MTVDFNGAVQSFLLNEGDIYKLHCHSHFKVLIDNQLEPIELSQWKDLYKKWWAQFYGHLSTLETKLFTAVKTGDVESLMSLLAVYQEKNWQSLKQGDDTSLVSCAAFSSYPAILDYIYHTGEQGQPGGILDPIVWAMRCKQYPVVLAYIKNANLNSRALKKILYYAAYYQATEIQQPLYQLYKQYTLTGDIKDIVQTLFELHDKHHCLTTLSIAVLCDEVDVVDQLVAAEPSALLYELFCKPWAREPALLTLASQQVLDIIFKHCRLLQKRNTIHLSLNGFQSCDISLFQAALLCQQKNYVLKRYSKHPAELLQAPQLFEDYYCSNNRTPAYIDTLIDKLNHQKTKTCCIL